MEEQEQVLKEDTNLTVEEIPTQQANLGEVHHINLGEALQFLHERVVWLKANDAHFITAVRPSVTACLNEMHEMLGNLLHKG